MSFSSRFKRDQLISEGQALTWKGHDTQTSDAVVIKELRLSDRTRWKGLELFEREVLALEQLSHPSIPKLLGSDLGHEDPQVWLLAQEWIPGEDLRSAPQMDEAAIRDLIEKLLEVLVYLQTFSPPLIHRDIKPANIILSGDLPILVDFGAVQLVTPSDEGGSTIVGTSGYMAPEQLMGRTSASSDLYGLGMTLVWLTTRCEPDTLPVSRMKTVWEDALVAPVSRALRDFINRLISPLEKDRFVDAATALRALQRNAAASAVRCARPMESELELISNDSEFEFVQHITTDEALNAWRDATLLLILLLVGWAMKISWPVLMIAGVIAAVAYVNIRRMMVKHKPQGFRFRITGDSWQFGTGDRVVAQGAVSEIYGFFHVGCLALVCEDRTHMLFEVSRAEEEWLAGELKDFLSRRP